MAEVYPSNSNKAKEASLIRESTPQAPVDIPRQPVEDNRPRVPVKSRRISPVREVFHAIFPGGFAELKEHIIWDVFVPWMQDAFHSGWDAVGDVMFPGSNTSYRGGGTPERVSYESRYRGTYQPQVSYDYYDSEGMKPYRTEQEARDKLKELRDILRRYGVVRLIDFNEIVGNPTRPTQAAYGWINLNTADVVRSRGGGYVIKMPHAVPIDS